MTFEICNGGTGEILVTSLTGSNFFSSSTKFHLLIYTGGLSSIVNCLGISLIAGNFSSLIGEILSEDFFLTIALLDGIVKFLLLHHLSSSSCFILNVFIRFRSSHISLNSILNFVSISYNHFYCCSMISNILCTLTLWTYCKSSLCHLLHNDPPI